MWRIVPQPTKWGDVKCKTLRWYPSEDPDTGEMRLKRMSPIIQVCLAFGASDKITKVKFARKSASWVIQLPDKLVPVTFKAYGELHVDHLAEPVVKPGERLSFKNIGLFYDKLVIKFGATMANEIVQLMHDEMNNEEM